MKQRHIFFVPKKVFYDERLNAWHLSIYFALVELFKQSDCESPFSISRRKVMRLARIRAAPTYHKYMGDLQEMGYINYIPSFHPKMGSLIELVYIVET